MGMSMLSWDGWIQTGRTNKHQIKLDGLLSCRLIEALHAALKPSLWSLISSFIGNLERKHEFSFPIRSITNNRDARTRLHRRILPPVPTTHNPHTIPHGVHTYTHLCHQLVVFKIFPGFHDTHDCCLRQMPMGV